MPTARILDIIHNPTVKKSLTVQKSTGWTSGDRERQTEGTGTDAGGKARRVTGSADIPLNADGKKQSKDLAKEKATKPFDYVFCSPEKRATQTAKEFGSPVELSGLDAWKRGAMEGKPVDQVKGQIKFLMLNPDKKPAGKSPESGEPGESLNAFALPLLATVQAIEVTNRPGERVLIVTHGGNLQTIDAWLKAGKKPDLSFDHKKMAQMPYWSVLGKMFRLADRSLEEVPNNEDPGVYACEHASTDFNQSTGAQGSRDEAPARPSASPAKPLPTVAATKQ